ncbi:MAG TPA: adenosylcobinamide-GDP ribazoletransferase [Candidatus Latescibacteria bacterium]|jgi:adenosylcobinamide-GDP ribazoletransferase|nr:adenosylcobinamide-GDP ribazoletransferase [Gemmatimonadaceae bacterium]MDP6016578.1 adenosylcobinamide-GDP ribazoletransferase [Candidatus Latescibacterota bacterium]HJP34085.1 adenosylcobinamide-GDP ribazoletransferase [Candidatus Latescibacterota bacterium]
MREIRLFFTALTFYTRLPGLRLADHSETGLNLATRYFPLVGIIVGCLVSAVFLVADRVLPTSIAVVISMGASIWITGAFHEDGLADTCDGLGGGWSKEDVLRIMKDSRLGTYGAVGLVLALLLKYSALLAVPVHLVPAALICGHAASRLVPVVVMSRLEYVREDETSKTRPVARGIGGWQVVIAAVPGLLPLWLLEPLLWAALLPMAVTGAWLTRHCHRRLGGYTGDTLGALQQVCELAFYLGVIALWTYTSSATLPSP